MTALSAAGLPDGLLSYAPGLWEVMARPDQKPPHQDWHIWLLLGGRGSGKTRSGAEWVREQVWQKGRRHIALIAPSLQEAREVMLEGPSGLMNIGFMSERPVYSPARRRLTWANGAVGYVYSSADPDSLRGAQFDCAWADEFCAWDYPNDTLANLRLALRLGEAPQLVVTTTPKPIPALRTLMRTPGLVTSRSKTDQNRAHLSPGFLAIMEEAYGGTSLARQEMDGEIVENTDGALWTRAMFDDCRVAHHPTFDKLIMAVDPPACRDARGNACGMVLVGWVADSGPDRPLRGRSQRGRAYVVQDATVRGLRTGTWADIVLGRYYTWGVDYIVIETNMGGDMVEDILRLRDPDILIHPVKASRGKRSRAEPVAALYEQGKVHHIKTAGLEALEDELIHLGRWGEGQWGASRGSSSSPDRADALVWAITDLMVRPRPIPRVGMVV